MKKILHLFAITVLLASCEKESLSRSQLIGSWEIKKILPLDANSDIRGLDFRNGIFTFNKNGSFVLTDNVDTYEGHWILHRDEYSTNCNTDQDGIEVCDHDWTETLELEATQTSTQQKKAATFQFVAFLNEHSFTGKLYSPVGRPAFEYTFEKKN
jgi:hypothetical protein